MAEMGRLREWKQSILVAFEKQKSNFVHLVPSPVSLIPGKKFALTQVRMRSAPLRCQDKRGCSQVSYVQRRQLFSVAQGWSVSPHCAHL